MNHWVSLSLSSGILALCSGYKGHHIWATSFKKEFRSSVSKHGVGWAWILWWGRDDAQESAVGRNPAFWFYFPLVLLCFVAMTNSVSSCFRRNSSSSSVTWWVSGETGGLLSTGFRLLTSSPLWVADLQKATVTPRSSSRVKAFEDPGGGKGASVCLLWLIPSGNFT